MDDSDLEIPEITSELNVYREFFEHLPVGGFLLSADGTVALANTAFADLVNRGSASSLIGKKLEDVIAGYDRHRLPDDTAENDFSTGCAEFQFGHGDTDARWFELCRAPIRNSRGKSAHLVGTLRDITDKKMAEIALRESENRYKEIFEGAPIGIFHTTAQGKLVAANPAFAHSIGYETPEELIEEVNKTGIASLYGDPSRRDAVSSSTLESSGWHSFRGEYRRRNKTPGIGRMMLRSYLPVGSSIPQLEGFMEDITVQEESRLALERETALLTALMNTVPERIYFKDGEGCYALVNKAQAIAFGFSDPHDVAGKRSSEFYTPEYVEKIERDETHIRSSGQAVADREERETMNDGRETWVLATRMPLRNADGSIVGTIGVTHDIGVQKRLEAQMIRAHRLESLGQLAAGIAHQFNNINTAISGYLTLISSDSELSESTAQYVEKAIESIQRSTGITRSLNILSSNRHSRQQLIRIEDVVRAEIHELNRMPHQNTANMSFDLTSTIPILTDEGTVEFVLASALSNAFHAVMSQSSPEITVRTRKVGWLSSLEIIDNGIGIAEEDLPRVFTPFFTTKGEWAEDGSTQAKVKGVGLSLSVCRSIVRAQGGSVEIESRPGAGTIVRFLFPVVDSPH